VKRTLSDRDLLAMRERCDAATPGPWRHMREGRDHTSGDSFIMTGSPGNRRGDLYVTSAAGPVSAADYEFIAIARRDIPALLDEIERLRRLLPSRGSL
jgi:hypothetical protein